jgi:hypothetical protein
MAPDAAADALDVVADGRAEGQHGGAVAADQVVVEVEDLDVFRGVGQKQLAGAGHVHERYTLAGELRLEELAHAARAGRVEVGLPLIGHHRAQPRLDGPVLQEDLEQLAVLLGERVGVLGLLEAGEVAVNHRDALSTIGDALDALDAFDA